MASQDDGAALLPLLPEEEQHTTVTVMVTSGDGQVFELEAAAARQSALLRDMMQAGAAEGGIPLPMVRGDVLALAVEYVRRHSCQKPVDGDGGGIGEHGVLEEFDSVLEEFDKKLVGRLGQTTLIDLLCAADYMSIEGLFDLTCQTLADMVSGKTIEAMRQIFGVESDYTPEEEAELRREISWALD